MAETIGKHRETEFSGGRPKLEITARDINQIENLSAIGMSQKEISHILEISPRTYSSWSKNEDVFAAISRGKAKGLAAVGKALHDKAIGGDTSAMMWYEKTRGRRTDRVEVVQQDQAQAITRLIGVMTPDQLQRVADGESPTEVLGSDT